MLERALLVTVALLILPGCSEDQTVDESGTQQKASVSNDAVQTPAAIPQSKSAGSSDSVEGAGKSSPAPRPAASAPSLSASEIAVYQGRPYVSGPVSLYFGNDGIFTMSELEGIEKVTGGYEFENGIITFFEAEGAITTSQFPMRCHFEPVGASDFRLSDVSGSCIRLHGRSFKPDAG